MSDFYTTFKDLREHEYKFFIYFRMSIKSFDELHDRLKKTLQRQNTFMRDCIEPLQMLAVTLRYLASGCTFTDLHLSYRLGISTISNIVKKVCISIWEVMLRECIPLPTKEKWELIAEEFEKRANFPHCLGAVDGEHIRIINPLGSMYHNYKGYSSVVLMAVADDNYRFIYVDIGSYGKDCDSSVFKRSSLWTSVINGNLEIPTETNVTGIENHMLQYYFLGDEAFALHKHLLRPFGGSQLSEKKRIFNYRLSRVRRFVECTFGILSNKWRIFHRPINLEPDFAVTIVKACVILHNFVRDRNGYQVEDTEVIIGLEEVQREHETRGGLPANNIRNVLSDYFASNAGALEWQMLKI
ncbi:uncharacterized protein LOC126902086 [Daktulosphaira vitifoliae]|uniref:uncharacterized protein LOC126902086 n=1 Tax=Daktulosphaira vitifoliae TaxID=58002 RepID=UPI0021A99B9B|nr:uncharacterized protein LOC126902086 [Daktulosphaira vitifoliae]